MCSGKSSAVRSLPVWGRFPALCPWEVCCSQGIAKLWSLLRNLGKIEDGQQSLPDFHIPLIFPFQSEREPDKPRRGQSFWKWRADHLLLNEDFPILTSFVLQRSLLHLGCRVYKGVNLQCSWQERDTWLAAFLWTCCAPSAPSLTLPVILNPFGEWEVAWVNNSCL